MQANTLTDIKENLFFSIKQPNITIIPTSQKLDSRTPDEFMSIIWNQGGHSITIKSNITIGYVKETECIKKSQIYQQENVREVSKISQDKLPPMPEKSVSTLHHNFCPKPRIELKETKISEETQNRLQVLKQDDNDIVS